MTLPSSLSIVPFLVLKGQLGMIFISVCLALRNATKCQGHNPWTEL